MHMYRCTSSEGYLQGNLINIQWNAEVDTMNISPLHPVGASIIGESMLLLDVAKGYQMIIAQQSTSNISL